MLINFLFTIVSYQIMQIKQVPSSEFRIFKQYIKGLVGCARQNLLNQCSKIMEEQTDGLETCTELVSRGDMSPDNIIGQQKSGMFRR